MLFNSVLIIWAAQFLGNIFFLKRSHRFRYKAGCFIWVGAFFTHFLTAFWLIPQYIRMSSTEEEKISAIGGQSPGLDHPFFLFIIGFLGSIILQIIFNTGLKSKDDSLPELYGQE
jgi:glycerol uptake facilitator-like aquaporin